METDAPPPPRGVFGHLESMGPDQFEGGGDERRGLYSCLWTSQAVMRHLPPIAKQFVLRLLFLHAPVTTSVFHSWTQVVKPGSRELVLGAGGALACLERLHVLTRQAAGGGKGGDGGVGGEDFDGMGGMQLGMGLADVWRVPAKDDVWVMNSDFRSSMQEVMTSTRESPWDDNAVAAGGGGGVGVDDKLRGGKRRRGGKRMASEKLNTWGMGKWETVLYFMVKGGLNCEDEAWPDATVVDLLLRANLIQRGAPGQGGGGDGGEAEYDEDDFRITQEGYEFVLRERHVQQWMLLKEYMDRGKSPTERRDLLWFVFQLSFCAVGRPCPVGQLTSLQQEVLDDFQHLGLLYRSVSQPSIFYPTVLATTLVFSDGTGSEGKSIGGGADGKGGGADEGGVGGGGGGGVGGGGGGGVGGGGGAQAGHGIHIVTETNFRVYAYDSTPLQLALLELFVDVRYHFPNLVCGDITRESVMRALHMGITAEQMFVYLKKNAHPDTMGRKCVVPTNVADRLILWENERSRANFRSCTVFDTFASRELFDQAERYANKRQVLLWSSKDKMKMVIRRIGATSIDNYVRRWTERNDRARRK